MALTKLLGEKVIKLEEEGEVQVDVSSLEGEGKVVGIYFSAHWCPPCRAFTPEMAKWYKRLRDGPIGEKLNIVFVSSDRNVESFNKYLRQMPWLALPYSERDRKTELSKHFKVTGIPTLVLIDALTGETITGDGRSIVMEDESGKDFPWTPKPFLEVISSGSFKGPEGKELDPDVIKGKVVGLFFSADWCGPCRIFTPKLIETYKKVKEAGKNFEVIFASSDKDEDEWKAYSDSMPWLSIPFGDRRIKTLSRMFEVQGIPTLFIMSEEGEVIINSGQAAVLDDPDGEKFPWIPEPVRQLTTLTSSDVNDYPSLIWFNEDVSSDESLKVLEPIAKARIEEAKAADQEVMQFFVVGNDSDDEDEAATLMRNFARVGTKNPLLVITDVSNQMVYVSDAETIDAGTIEQFIEGYYKKTINGRPLGP